MNYSKQTIVQEPPSKLRADVLLRQNLAYFQYQLPTLYTQIMAHAPQQFWYAIDTHQQHNIQTKKGFVYTNYTVQTQQQIDEYLKHYTCIRFDLGHSTWAKTHYLHDFHLERMRQAFHQVPKQHRTTKPDIIPVLLYLGSGLGLQIEQLQQQLAPLHSFIIEPNLDLFLASLQVTDYQALANLATHKKTSLHFIVGQTASVGAQTLIDTVKNQFPYAGVELYLFSHQTTLALKHFQQQLQNKYHRAFTSLGFIDDELIGLSHWRHKILTNQSFLKKNKALQQCPVFVIGSGPSIDQHIQTIKAYQNKAIIISCSSSIEICYKNGITPDFHVEVERNKVVADIMAKFPDQDYLKSITLVGLSTLHPNTAHFYRQNLYVLKYNDFGTAIANTLLKNTDYGPFDEGIAFSPTGGNGAVALALFLGCRDLKLFGMDLGMKHELEHHSTASMYYGKDSPWARPKVKADLQLPGNFGGEVLSTFLLDNARWSLEYCLAAHPDVRCDNYSDGVLIQGATPKRIESGIDCSTVLEKKSLVAMASQACYPKQDYPALLQESQLIWMKIYSQFELLVHDFLDITFSQEVQSKQQLFVLFDQLQHLLSTAYAHSKLLQHLVFGAFHQLMHTASSLLLNIKDGPEFKTLAQQLFTMWQQHLTDSLTLCKQGFDQPSDLFDYKALTSVYSNSASKHA